jgi:hypothetical protein
MNEIVSMAVALILVLMILSGTAGAQSRDEKYVIKGIWHVIERPHPQ